MSDMVHELQKGVEKVAEKVKMSYDATQQTRQWGGAVSDSEVFSAGLNILTKAEKDFQTFRP